MSCPCGSTKCVCQEACFCTDNSCHCRKCQLLEKICPRCNLPFYVITLKEDYERQVCSCANKGAAAYYPEAQSHLQKAASAMSDRSSISPVRGDHCPRCSLPVLLVTADEDFDDKVRFCCCSQRNLSTDNPDMSTEHETSTCTSDHREVSADRQVRKALSRKTRTEKSKWQAKKIKERSSNSFDESSFTETVDEGENRAESSSPVSHEQNPSSVGLSESFLMDMGNLNPDSNTQAQTGHSSRAEDTPTANVSLEVNTSGIAGPSTSSEFLPRQGGERMNKWFETLENVIITSGELPDAETAAALDKEDKERLKEEPSDKGEEQSEEEPGDRPEGQSQKNGEDDIDPTTDTERSSSKSPKESESD